MSESTSDVVMDHPSAEDLAYVSTVFNALADALVRFGRPMPPTVARAGGILDRALTFAMSFERHAFGADSGQSSKNIGTAEVAELLGVTRRTVQRRAEALGGQRVSRSYVFDKNELGANLDG